MPDCSISTCDNLPSYECGNCNGQFCYDCVEVGPDGKGRFCPHCDTLLSGKDKGTALPQPKQSHKGEITRIKKYVETIGGHPYVLHQVGQLRGSSGIPDMCAFLPTRNGLQFVWIEVKVGDDSLREEQEKFVKRCGKSGQPCVVGDLDDVEGLASEIW